MLTYVHDWLYIDERGNKGALVIFRTHFKFFILAVIASVGTFYFKEPALLLLAIMNLGFAIYILEMKEVIYNE